MRDLIILAALMFAAGVYMTIEPVEAYRLLGLCALGLTLLVAVVATWCWLHIRTRVIVLWWNIAKKLAKTPEDRALIERAERAVNMKIK